MLSKISYRPGTRTDIVQERLSIRNIKRKRVFLAGLSSRRNGSLGYYTDVLDDIEPGIIPLVRALDTHLTTPIFSCQGHWISRQEPYVMFIVLPGKEWEFQRFILNLVRTAPEQFMGMRFGHRLQPQRFGTGPFIDWKMTLEVYFEKFRSPKSFEIRSQNEIFRYAKLIIDEMRKWQARKQRKG